MRLALLFTLLLLAAPAGAQELTLNFGPGESLAGRSLLLIAAITLISLAPGLAVMVTCFPFIVTVLSICGRGWGCNNRPRTC